MKEMITSRGASQILGVPEEIIVADIEANTIESLIGQKFADYTLLYSWQIEGEFGEYHRKRLGRDRESEAL